ncbi:MAG TPA: hypothetical protein VFX21_05665 [Acidimicrobiia bacterium]|nr:hypothetical protein [Acidimicrobiia bacterium]
MRRVRLLLLAAAFLAAVSQLFALARMVDDRMRPVAETVQDDRATITARVTSAPAVVASVTQRRRDLRTAVMVLGFAAALFAALLRRGSRQRALATLTPRLRLHGPPRAVRRGPPHLHVTA